MKESFFKKYGANLSPRERDVIALRYGCLGGRMRPTEEVSEIFGETVDKTIASQRTAETKIDEMFSEECQTQASIFGYYRLLQCIFPDSVKTIDNIDFVKLKEDVDAVLRNEI